MVKRITHSSGKVFCLGRNRPKPGQMKLHMRNVLNLSKLPTPPTTCSYSPAAATALSQMYLNDQYGDCVIAGMAHTVGVLTGNSGVGSTIFTPAQIVSLYSDIGGFNPENPQATDNGCDEVTAWTYWKNTGAPAGANKIAGWISVDGTNPAEYTAACWLFENLLFGVELPDSWISPFPSEPGFVWDAGVSDPDNGHCFLGVDYYPDGSVAIDTWGMLGRITPAAMAKNASTAGSGELYAVVSQESLIKATAKAPSGFDWEQTCAYFEEMGGGL